MKLVSLFKGSNVNGILGERLNDMAERIKNLPENRIFQSNVDQLCEDLVNAYAVSRFHVLEQGIRTERTKPEASKDSVVPYSTLTPRFRITCHVPIEGDARMLRYRPTQWSQDYPQAEIITGSETRLCFIYDIRDESTIDIQQKLQQDLKNLKQWFQWANADIEKHNAQLKIVAAEQVRKRATQVNEEIDFVEKLGFPLKRRADAPQAHVLPMVRKKLELKTPQPNKQSSDRELVLLDEHYEHILSVIRSMTLVMEQSPRAFSEMSEEDLRWHYLVQLNGHYEGQATGETFNYEGKTDIIIKWQGRNIFIAECKIWRGPQSFNKALDQLLGYACWRDTKTALIVFVKAMYFKPIIEQIPELLKQHPNAFQGIERRAETEFRCKFRHLKDPERILTVAVLAFHIPQTTTS